MAEMQGFGVRARGRWVGYANGGDFGGMQVMNCSFS